MTAPRTPSWLCSAATGRHPLAIRRADGFFQRLRGLMFQRRLPSDEGLLLSRCASVHTAFMRFPIDVAYLDGHGTVLQCVPNLPPWRASTSRLGWWAARRVGGVHTLELPAGSLQAWQVAVGDRLEGPHFHPAVRPSPKVRPRQLGAAMIEFAVVAPAVTLLGMSVLQAGMVFNAKSVMNHAAFMAARQGSVAHADLSKVQDAYVTALSPLYGKVTDTLSREEVQAKVATDLLDAAHPGLRIELLNPTKESFDDWNDPTRQQALKTGKKRVIPNANLAQKLGDADTAKTLGTRHDFKNIGGELVKKSSGQSLSDANLIKLRITQGYQPKVPLMGLVYAKFLQWSDPHTDAFVTDLIAQHRIPVVSDVTVHMQSDAIEPDTPVSTPGEGNHGTPDDPGSPPNPTAPPPDCASADCTRENPPSDVPRSPPGECGAEVCRACQIYSAQQTLKADGLFAFDKSSIQDLQSEGKKQLDDLVAYAKAHHPTSVTIRGHTDNLGSDAHNQTLSLNRAKAVRDYMRQKGLPDVPVTVEGKGSSDPVKDPASCNQPVKSAQIDCLQPNRRVEVFLQGVDE